MFVVVLLAGLKLGTEQEHSDDPIHGCVIERQTHVCMLLTTLHSVVCRRRSNYVQQTLHVHVQLVDITV